MGVMYFITLMENVTPVSDERVAVTEERLDGVQVVVYQPKRRAAGAELRRAIIYLHGGGWCLGSSSKSACRCFHLALVLTGLALELIKFFDAFSRTLLLTLGLLVDALLPLFCSIHVASHREIWSNVSNQTMKAPINRYNPRYSQANMQDDSEYESDLH